MILATFTDATGDTCAIETDERDGRTYLVAASERCGVEVPFELTPALARGIAAALCGVDACFTAPKASCTRFDPRERPRGRPARPRTRHGAAKRARP